jgi:hypothetical protein
MEPTDHHPREAETADGHEPLPPPPRAARRRPGRRGLFGHVPVGLRLLFLAGVVLLLLVLWQTGSVWFVRLFGITVPGEVTGTSPGAKGEKGGRVQFSYHVRQEEYSAEDTVDEATFEWLRQGTPVHVRVLPAFPRRALLVGPAGRAGSEGGVYLAFALIGIFALATLLRVYYLREPLRQRALVRAGVATRGVLVRKEAGGGRGPWAVEYTYRAPRHGAAHPPDAGDLGRPAVADREWQVRMALRQADFEAARVGAAVTVLYDPRHPARSVIYRFAEYEVLPAAGADSAPGL